MFCDCVSQMAVEENSISAISVTMKAGMRMREMNEAVDEADQRADREHDGHRQPRREGVPARRPPSSSISVPPQGAAAEQCRIAAVVITTAPSDADESHDGALGRDRSAG